MLLDVLLRVSFFHLLHCIDKNFAVECKDAGCPHCGGPLHDARYVRKPRGGPDDLPDDMCVRLGLCCGKAGCRRRTLPPSVLFFGRRVYWGGVVVILTAVLQGRDRGYSYNKLRRMFGVTRQTLKGWQAWFRDELHKTTAWQVNCGMLRSEATFGEQPSTAVEFLQEATGDTGHGVVKFLSLLCGGSLAVAEARIARGEVVYAEHGDCR